MKEQVAKILAKHTKLKESEIINLIEIPPSSDMGDFAFPCFILAKEMKRNPSEIAGLLAKKIKSSDFEKIESRGPYINFFLDRKKTAEETIRKIMKEKDRYGSMNKKEKIVIEFPSPNTNKPLHIGHARNIVLGQSISNILNFCGNKVVVTNLNNDRGIHICKSMVAYEKFGKGNSPEKAKRKSDHFVGDYYIKFAQELQKNKNLDNEAQLCLQKWEAGDKKTLDLWKKMNSWALKGFKETYKKFGLKIDKNYFESKIYNSGKEIIREALKKGIVQKKEDGALYIDLSNEGLGEKILLRADGTSIYITQDIYLALLKKKEYNFDTSIYVSATEQNHHFRTLFAILKKLGYSWADNLLHLNYGMVNLESGRMETCEGNGVDSDDLINELKSLSLEEINKRFPKLSQKEKEKRAEAISLSALRYYFLRVERIKDVVFKPEESISFEGNTGPYLLYSYARAKSILKKAKSIKNIAKVGNQTDKEKGLILELAKFPEIVENAYKNLAPNIIANYAYQLSQKFNEFYHSSPVLGSEEEQFRLSLVSCFSQTLKNSLSLLGINVLEKM